MDVFDVKEAGTPEAADVPAMMCAVVGVCVGLLKVIFSVSPVENVNPPLTCCQ